LSNCLATDSIGLLEKCCSGNSQTWLTF